MTMDPIEWRCTQEQAFMDALLQTVTDENTADEKVAVLSLKMTGIRKLRGIYGRAFMEKGALAIHEKLKAILRPDDHLQALGNCEFLLCLPRMKNTGHMKLAINKLIRELDKEYEIDDKTVATPAIIGAALYPDTTESPVNLINAAEFALAQAGENGEKFRISDPLTDDSQALWDLDEEFRHALNNDELLLFYQPQLSLNSGRINGVEALIRWQHPKRGLVSPGLFIPIIEQTDLIHKVTHWALHRALREQKEWLARGHDISVSVNIAGKNFSEPSFRETVLNALSLWGSRGEKLILEITESELMDNLEQVGSELEALRDAGVRISIDDFGTGYSSLSYLSRLPVDEIKIDRSFIQNMAAQEQDERIVVAIIQMAREFQTSILAEGIEDQIIYDRLRELGCELGQGYHMSRPIPHEELMDWLDEHGE
jgi:EAL domain-containing protein (putative c-di-GMP-specific phosphodiesterase class I)/GGDEF domain-containing protein